jgi:hypothetical protein
MLPALDVGRQLEPVDPERLAAELAPDEADGAARPCALERRNIDDRISHVAGP